jgi:hypothetical protein
VATKRVLRYLKGAIGFGMHFVKSSSVNLVGYSDSDWGKGDEEMMSTLGYCFAIGDRIFCYNSKKQFVVTHSTTEAEYIAAYVAAKQLIWLRKMLTDMDFDKQSPT